MRRHPDFECRQLNDDSVQLIPGLEIYSNRRKIYRDREEISLTMKEYDLFYLLVVNRGHILTYSQIYQKIWGAEQIIETMELLGIDTVRFAECSVDVLSEAFDFGNMEYFAGIKLVNKVI